MNSKNRNDLKNRIVLTVLLLTGVFLSYQSCVVLVGMLRIRALAAVFIALIVVAVSGIIPRLQRAGEYILAAGAAAVVVIEGARSVYGGLLGFLNYLISRWNIRYEQSQMLFVNEEITDENLAVFSVVLMILMTALVWHLIRENKAVGVGILTMGIIFAGALLGCNSSMGAAFLVTAGIGCWMDRTYHGHPARKTAFLLSTCLLVCGMAFLCGQDELTSVTDIREYTGEKVQKIRYGEDTLPEGDLSKAQNLLNGSEETLKITRTQHKDLYLRGFVGASYQAGRWHGLPGNSYGGDYSGMIKWLTKREFVVQTQYDSYLEAEGTDELTADEVTVENVGARRNYLYLPYSAELPQENASVREDAEIRATGILGTREYSFRERSENIPAELLYISDWVTDPQTEEQTNYLESEAVYRKFVYENYLELDDETKALMEAVFWDEADPEEKEGIYGSVQRVRQVLEETVRYEEEPEAFAGDTDYFRWVLLTGREGNAVAYASVAVEALRANGIPARYVEGYLIRQTEDGEDQDGTVTLTNQNSHAWAEVYMDGMGWMPVDVTPGFYYDTYTLMEMVQQPQGVQQTAAMEESNEEANQIIDESAGRSKISERLTGNEIMLLVLGILVLILVILVTGIVLLEIVRLIRLWGICRRYRSGSLEQCAEQMCERIHKLLNIMGIENELGWNTAETEEELIKLLPVFEEGEYRRVSQLMEKRIYGEQELGRAELAVLIRFCEKIYSSQKYLTLKVRIKLRYLAT